MTEQPDRERRRRILASVPAVLLVVLAATNRFTVATTDLSPWELGGFGMFSSIDAPETRSVVATGISAAGDQVEIVIPPNLSDAESRLLVWPTATRGRQLAEQLLADRWSLDDGSAVRSDTGVELARVRIVVTRIEVVANDLITLETLVETEAP